MFSDLAMARRLENAEAHSNVEFVEARANAFPDSGAQWINVAGAYAMFDGVDSPLTQTFGLGLFSLPAAGDMDRLEQFFRQRGAPVFHEVSPLADPGLLPLLNERGYQPFELTSVLARPIVADVGVEPAPDPRIHVRQAGRDEQEAWARMAARGWSESPELAGFMLTLSQISARRQQTVSFFAERDGLPIATGAVSLCDGVAVLAGASTVPEGRKQGAQLALLECRLRYAAQHGCDVAMMGALPGSASQRNAERRGFRIMYTRIKWRLAQAARA